MMGWWSDGERHLASLSPCCDVKNKHMDGGWMESRNRNGRRGYVVNPRDRQNKQITKFTAGRMESSHVPRTFCPLPARRNTKGSVSSVPHPPPKSPRLTRLTMILEC